MIVLVNFVDALEQRRRMMGLTHGDFADYLGVSLPYWSLVRRGKKPAGNSFVGRVTMARPELFELIERKESAAA